MKTLVQPGIADGAPSDEDAVELCGSQALDSSFRLEKVAASYERCFREMMFDFRKKVPIDLAGEFLYDGACMYN